MYKFRSAPFRSLSVSVFTRSSYSAGYSSFKYSFPCRETFVNHTPVKPINSEHFKVFVPKSTELSVSCHELKFFRFSELIDFTNSASLRFIVSKVNTVRILDRVKERANRIADFDRTFHDFRAEIDSTFCLVSGIKLFPGSRS